MKKFLSKFDYEVHIKGNTIIELIFFTIFLIILFGFISILDVHAATWTNKKPVYTSTTTIEGYQETQVSFQNNFWGDLSGWESPYYYDSGFTKNITWRYNGAPFLGNDWSIRGQIFTTTESGNAFFKNVPYSIYILTDYGTEPCTTEAGGYAGRSGNYTTFSCSGTSTNRMQVVLNTGSYSMNATYFMLRSDWSELKTDLSNGSMVGSIDNSIKESENNINNNISAMGSSINSNIDEMKEKQDETNKQLGDLNDNITSEEGPNLAGLENSAGWLPAGPVDSILNLPLSFFDNLSANLGGNCQPITFTLPFFNENISLPCINTIYSQIEGLTPWINTIAVLISSLILFKYLLNLYHWVDDTLSFRENNWNDQDQWGGL